MKKATLLTMAGLALGAAGCMALASSPCYAQGLSPKGGAPTLDARVAGPEAVDVKTLEDEIKSAHPPVLIDVREPFEREAGTIPGDTNIPMGDLLSHLNDIPKDKPVILYCRSGNRSGRAVAMLQGKGYTNVKTLVGGMNAWSARDDQKCPSC